MIEYELTEHQKELLDGYGASRWSKDWDEHGNGVIELTNEFYRWWSGISSYGDRTETRVMGTVTPEEWAAPLDLDVIDKAAEGNELQHEIQRMTALIRRMQTGARKMRDEAESRNDYSDHHGWSDVRRWASAVIVGAKVDPYE